MLDKYFNYIIVWILGILGITTVVGLLSAGQPQISPLQSPSFKKFSLFPSSKSELVFTSTVILGWDIMLSRTIWSDNKKLWYWYSFSGMHYHPISAIPNCMQWNCLLIMNLESPFSKFDNDYKQRTFIFRANTGNITTLNTLRDNNTMVLSLANNHINNAGGEWVVTTRKLLDEYWYNYVGAGSSRDESRSILNVVHQNITRCISAYSYDGNWGIYWGKPLYRNPLYLSWMIADLEEMKNNITCDVKAMMVHWWREYKIHATQEQSLIARTLIDNWLDIVIWSHSHVPWTIEKYKGKYIFYSLGNALFDQDWWMESVQSSMDTIYDALLGKETVPTYIALFPELYVTKTTTWTSISLIDIHGSRIEKWVFFPLDEDTKQSIVSSPYVYE